MSAPPKLIDVAKTVRKLIEAAKQEPRLEGVPKMNIVMEFLPWYDIETLKSALTVAGYDYKS